MKKPAPRPSWTPELRQADGPIYLALADAMAADIAAGRLRPGQSLPAQRALAEELDVDLTTVTRAYKEAQRRGLIEATVGRGTFVSGGESARPKPVPQSPVDMTMNLPPQPDDAALTDRLARGLAAVQRRPDLLSLLSYSHSAGTEQDRAAGAEWLRPRLGDIAGARVVIGAGAQATFAALLTTFAGPGDTVVTEAMTYPGFRSLAAHLGVKLVGVEMDAEGLVPEALDEACRAHQPKAIYCTPTIHNPTTATMSEPRRAAIAAVARQHALPIIEDDVYGHLASDAPAPLAMHAPERTYYVHSLAKIIAPGLRIAYCVAPDIAAAMRLGAAVRAMTLMAAPLMAALATQWIGDGSARAILDAVRHEAAARQRMVGQILTGATYVAHPEGHHLWLSVPAEWNPAEFASYLRPRGVAIVASDAFTAQTAAPAAVRLSLGAATDRAQLEHILHLVAATLAQSPATLSTVI
jgi:DNA-binding transcriptional MocR family regulator